MELFLLFLLVAAIGVIVLMMGIRNGNDKAVVFGAVGLVGGLAAALATAFLVIRDAINNIADRLP